MAKSAKIVKATGERVRHRRTRVETWDSYIRKVRVGPSFRARELSQLFMTVFQPISAPLHPLGCR